MNSKELVKTVLQSLSTAQSEMTVGLVGGLGLGKTHIVKEILTSISEELGKQVASPTYNLCNIYSTHQLEVHHYDLYRLESEDELYETGIMDSLERTGITIFIEWIDMFPMVANHCDQVISISLDEHGERDYTIQTFQ